MKIVDIRPTTVTVPLEAPLRHANGCHWGRFVRTIVEVEADNGLIGLGEMGGGGETAEAVFRSMNSYLRGHDPARMEEQVVKSMDDYSVHIFAALERHLPILGTISSVAPMIGSVGTIAGMMVLFQGILEKIGQVSLIEAASQGIQGKLVTTLFGLVVGIFAFVAYNYFTGVINRYVLHIEESASELMEGVTMNLAFKQKQADGRRLEPAKG